MSVATAWQAICESRLARLRVAFLFIGALTLPFNPAWCAISGVGDFLPNPLVDGAEISVGIASYGAIRIDNGSTFESENVVLGGSGTGIGFATISGPGTIWSVDQATIGSEGYGRLEISAGAVVQMTTENHSFDIAGNFSDSRGDVAVSGVNSLLHVAGGLRIAENGGSATLQVSEGAIVNAVGQETRIGGGGRVALNHGLLRTRGLYNDGLLAGSGEVEGGVFNHGRIEVLGGQALRMSPPQNGNGSSNSGDVVVDGGKLEFQWGLQNDGSGNQGGSIQLRNAEIRFGVAGSSFPGQLTNRGMMTVFGGETHVHGSIRNESGGVIAIANESLAVFHDVVENQYSSMISVSPGSNALFLQGLNMQGGTLLADITGLDGYGHVEVVGAAQLSGTLQVSLQSGFAPQVGNSFELLSATEGIGGHMSLRPESDLPPGMNWQLAIDDNRLLLNVVAAPLLGDYNFDGSVDAADYTVWRDARQSGNLAADGNNDGSVDNGDLDIWKAHFGTTSGGGSSALAVPEPTACLLVLAIFAAGTMTRRLTIR